MVAYVLLLFFFITFLRILLLYKRRHSTRRLPPEVPGGIPWLGHVTFLDRDAPHLTLTHWGHLNGPVYSFVVFGRPFLVLNSYDTIMEALVDRADDFSSRPAFFRITYGFHGNSDVIFGKFSRRWMTMKRIMSQSVNQSQRCSTVQNLIREELVTLTTTLLTYDGCDLDPRQLMMTAVLNFMTSMLTGRRHGYHEPLMRRYCGVTRLFSETCGVTRGVELDLWPWLRYCGNSTFRKLRRARTLLDDLVDYEFQLKEGSNTDVKTVIDGLLNAQRQSDSGLSMDDVRSMFIDILISGTLTTAIAINAFILLMSRNMDIQSSIHEELMKQVCDGNGTADTHGSPLLQSAILEVLRFISHVPLSLPHYTTTHTTVAGYHIPAETEVLINLWAVHHDDVIWREPWRYEARRFLDADGRLLHRSHVIRQRLLPFSVGRRRCIGSDMALNRIYLVSSRFSVSRGFVQSLLTSASAFAFCVTHFCAELEEFWPYQSLLDDFVKRLSTCVTAELAALMDIPGVKMGRARQLFQAGFKDLQTIAFADPEVLVQAIEHLPRRTAKQITSSAQVFLRQYLSVTLRMTSQMLLAERAEALLEQADELVAAPEHHVTSPRAMATTAPEVDTFSTQSTVWSSQDSANLGF